jgi:BASS family bile acid:Na+ symporter
MDERTLTTILSAVYLVSMMFALGLELGGGPRESKEKKRGKRRMLVRGLVFNLVVVPAIAFAVTRALHASSDVTIALLILVAAPGGRFAPHLVKLGAGEVPLAVELTLFLAKITAFTAAPTAKWLLTLHSLDIREVPLILQLLFLQIAPFYVAKWIRKKHRPLAERLLKPAQWLSLGAMLLVFVVVLLREDRGLFEVLHDQSWLAVIIVGILAPVVGWLVAGPHEGDRRALAITANARELGLALMIASLAFPGHGVHTAIFGIWSIYTLTTALLASGMRLGPRITARGQARAVPAGARSGPAH